MIDEIKSILEEVRAVPGLAAGLSDSASLIDDVGLDSLEMLTFMVKIEERLRVRIDFEQMDFSYLQSIRALCDFLARMEPLPPAAGPASPGAGDDAPGAGAGRPHPA